MGWLKRRGHGFRTVAPHPEKRREWEASGEEHEGETQQTRAHLGEVGLLDKKALASLSQDPGLPSTALLYPAFNWASSPSRVGQEHFPIKDRITDDIWDF